ncbi:transcriptional regulator, MerR family [Anaeromyxobacter dehalogenans 2CP-1]|uniref:Transcriptional regulator, MerR family n=1 Tax=Anaeromyxobacter dehalogenans (strain ATCC BAA-258 / DSM 21875 / 2CP-1) TaxID=455488 RepID=B8JAA3_ANAD2|nr:MerR family transcriptional regulator [Anaeromyxobacter dehalogenans]ACL65622.1 transcriptional regulator, MerR family [Anaeromyxobacter dehalogenans 2CP-1]
MSADLSSGDLARATGNTVRTIRFYEEEGLLRPAEVSDGGHRRYTEDELERLRLITDLRELGLALGEIRTLLELRSGCVTAAEFAIRFQQVLAGHLEQAQRRLERMRRVKKELLDALASIQERLSSEGAEQCPCAVAEAARAPRIVKVLARQEGCCKHPEHHHVHDAAIEAAAAARTLGAGDAQVPLPGLAVAVPQHDDPAADPQLRPAAKRGAGL